MNDPLCPSIDKDKIVIFHEKECKKWERTSTSKGNQTKYIIDGLYIKKDFLGYEGLAEFVCSLLLSCSDIKWYVKYNLCFIEESGHNSNACYSENFLKPGDSYITIHRLLDQLGYDTNMEFESDWAHYNIIHLRELIADKVKFDYMIEIAKTLRFDAIVLGEDRHFNNLGFIMNNGRYSDGPIFDNGLSLLSDLRAYPEDSQTFRKMVECKPFCRDFIRQIADLNKHGYKNIVINQSKFIAFMQSEDKLMKSYYNAETVERVKKIVFDRLKESEGELWENGI